MGPPALIKSSCMARAPAVCSNADFICALLLPKLLLAQLLSFSNCVRKQVERVLALLVFRADPRRAFGCLFLVLQLHFL